VAQLGANAHGEVLEPGRVPDCYLGLRPRPGPPRTGGQCPGGGADRAAASGWPQPDGTVLYELVTGHRDRAAGELVFLPDLTVELRAWPHDTWTTLGIDPQTAVGGVIAAWRGGHVKGLQLGGLSAEEAMALGRPAMSYVREQLRQRFARQVQRAWWRWLHPLADAGPATGSCSSGHRSLRQCPRRTPPSGHPAAAPQHRGHRHCRLPSGRPRRARLRPATGSTRPATADLDGHCGRPHAGSHSPARPTASASCSAALVNQGLGIVRA